MIESARDPNSPKVGPHLRRHYLDFFLLLLGVVTVCPPGVSRERHREPGFTPEGLRVQELQTHARSAIPLPRRLQT